MAEAFLSHSEAGAALRKQLGVHADKAKRCAHALPVPPQAGRRLFAGLACTVYPRALAEVYMQQTHQSKPGAAWWLGLARTSCMQRVTHMTHMTHMNGYILWGP